jgi:GNAT superfamily N-acetyltransferase
VTTVTIHHLELRSDDPFHPKGSSLEGVEVRHAEMPSPELQRFLYRAIGGDYFWIDRLNWTRAQWLESCERWQLHVLYVRGTIVGYFNLEPRGSDVDIAYFGLLPQFAGMGLGGYLLTEAVQRARGLGATRVTVNTCNLDGPHALRNYQARGFRITHTETLEKTLPETSPSFWASDG